MQRRGHSAAIALVGVLVLTGLGAAPRVADAAPRVRFDLEAGVGAARGDTRGAAFGLTGQLGLQAGDFVALYWQPGLHLYGWGREDQVIDTYGFTSQLAMLDLTPVRFLQLGGGGGFDIGRFGICDRSDGSTQCVYESSEARPAVEGRLALILPLPGVRARHGIPIALHYHVTFLDERRIHALTVALGFIRY